MEKYRFFTVLFMWLSGILFIISAIVILIYGIYNLEQNKAIKKNGINSNAIIEQKYVDEKNVSYKIKYVVNDEEYWYYFESSEKFYQKNKYIEIYYLPDNPNNIYVPIETEYFTQSMNVIYILLGLGLLCLKEFNIFKYRSSIEVV